MSLYASEKKLPANHPHPHAGGVCPIVGRHEYCPPQETDSRSPCPALNTLANHGYIRRNGKDISVWEMIDGLKAAYNLTTILAWILAFGGFILLFRFTRISLYEIGEHKPIKRGRIIHAGVEHDASLVHADTPKGSHYAPTRVHRDMVGELIEDVRSTTKFIEGPRGGSHRMLMDAQDVARARVRRERESREAKSPELDGLHAEIARGEMALVLNMFRVRDQSGAGVPTEWLREWITYERLPKGWAADPNHKTGLWETMEQSKAIKAEMERLREEEKRKPWTTSKSNHSRHGSNDSVLSTATSGTAFSRESSPRTAVGDDEDEKEF